MDSSQLYNQYFQLVTNYLQNYVDEHEAEGLAQEVFVKVHNGYGTFKGQSSVKTWIYRIATNVAMDYLKSRSKKERDLISDIELESIDVNATVTESPEYLNISEEMNSCIREFIHRLPSHYSTVLVLNEIEGYNIAEISELVGVPPGTVKVRLHRARLKLKNELEQGCVITNTCDSRMICERKKD